MNSHVVESTCELSAFIKGDAMSGSEKDAGFCSGGDEDDMSGLHSPSASEDSVEVQIMPISLRNKRKLAEPRKIQEQLLQTAPLKKRRFDNVITNNNNKNKNSCINSNNNNTVIDDDTIRSPSPFRPWSSSSSSRTNDDIKIHRIDNSNIQLSSLDIERRVNDESKEQRWLQEEARRRKEETQRLNEQRIHEEVLARLEQSEARRNSARSPTSSTHSVERRTRHDQGATLTGGELAPAPLSVTPRTPSCLLETSVVATSDTLTHPRLQEEPLALVRRDELPRVPAHPAVDGSFERSTMFSTIEQHQEYSQSESSHRMSPNHERNQHQQQQQQQQQQQRNYKNMTRERRIEANARERTRVHTISAAFDTLRRSIPAYSHNQKLSKLSVLRIACSYIMTLSKIANTPEGNDTTGPALGACVDLVSRTIQTEGKLRKKKDE